MEQSDGNLTTTVRALIEAQVVEAFGYGVLRGPVPLVTRPGVTVWLRGQAIRVDMPPKTE